MTSYCAKFLAFIGLWLAILTPAAQADVDPWTAGSAQSYVGPIRVDLAFLDQTGAARSAVLSSLPASMLAGMPAGLTDAGKSPLLAWQAGKGGYYDAVWASIRGQVCTDLQQRIQTLVNHSPNTAYDLQPCVLTERGYLTASFQTSWTNPALQQVTGRRVVLDYQVPLNGVTFWVTSPHTCHHGDTCPTEPGDPGYTVVFTAHITTICTAADGGTGPVFTLPAICQPYGSIVIEEVVGGDVTAQLEGASIGFVKQLTAEAGSIVASGGASAPAAAAAAIVGAVNVAIQGIGTAIAAVSDQHLRDQVSGWLIGFVGSPTLGVADTTAANDAQQLFQNLYFADLSGFKGVGMTIGADYGLDLTLGYPSPVKPTLQNTIAQQNATSLFQPSIAVAQPDVIAGQTIPVTGDYFRGSYVREIDLGWNKVVIGTPSTTIRWGPPAQTLTVGELAFHATNLQPATAYAFQVHECDGLTCAPWSDLLKATTQANGSALVKFWLDGNTAQIIGAGLPPATGNAPFTANVTIPPATPTGQHVLNAAAAGGETASAPIFVCQPGGCGPTVRVVDTSSGTVEPPGSMVATGEPATLRGSGWRPGGAAAIYIDAVTSAKIGTGLIGPKGNFQTVVSVPRLTGTQHVFIAVEGPIAHPLQPHPLPIPFGKAPTASDPFTIAGPIQ